MTFIDEIKDMLIESDFSMKLINECRMHFQYGGFDESDELEFKRLFSDNVRKSNLDLTDLQIEQIAQVCIDRGVLETKDILFLDGAAFVVKTDEFFPGENNHVDFVNYIWKSNDYKWCDFLNLTFFFTDERLTHKSKMFLSKLRDELNEIFVNYYNITTFPEELGMNSAVGQEFAIKCNVEEIIDGLNNNKTFSISIICNISGTKEILLIDLMYDPFGEKLVVINGMNRDAVKLTTLIEEKKSELKEDKVVLSKVNK